MSVMLGTLGVSFVLVMNETSYSGTTCAVDITYFEIQLLYTQTSCTERRAPALFRRQLDRIEVVKTKVHCVIFPLSIPDF